MKKQNYQKKMAGRKTKNQSQIDQTTIALKDDQNKQKPPQKWGESKNKLT